MFHIKSVVYCAKMDLRGCILKFTLFLVVLFDVFLITQIAAATTPDPLTGPQVNALISGNSMAGNGKHMAPSVPYDWRAYYHSDGTMVMRLKPAWGGIEDSGKWWVSDQGELCRQFKKMASGKPGCWHFFRKGEFIRFTRSGGVAVDGLGVVLPGNILDNAQ